MYTVGQTGGEATHKLTKDEMPEHNHNTSTVSLGNNVLCTNKNAGWSASTIATLTSSSRGLKYPYVTSEAKWMVQSMGDVGGNNPHNNMPPYITYYCFERIA